jgi:predicted nucleotidyltransferase
MIHVLHKTVLHELRRELSGLFGNDLDSLILYGSRARRDPRPDSDIDVLIVLNIPIDYADLIHRTSEIIARLSLQYDVVISRAFVSKEQYDHWQTPFLINVRREGVSI